MSKKLLAALVEIGLEVSRTGTFPSNSTLASKLGVRPHAAAMYVSRLRDLGFILKRSRKLRRWVLTDPLDMQFCLVLLGYFSFRSSRGANRYTPLESSDVSPVLVGDRRIHGVEKTDEMRRLDTRSRCLHLQDLGYVRETRSSTGHRMVRPTSRLVEQASYFSRFLSLRSQEQIEGVRDNRREGHIDFNTQWWKTQDDSTPPSVHDQGEMPA